MCGTAAIPSAIMERRFRKTTKFTTKTEKKEKRTDFCILDKSHSPQNRKHRNRCNKDASSLASRPLFSIYIMVRLYRKGLEHNNVTRFRYNSRYFTANATAHCRIDGAKKDQQRFFRSRKIPFYRVVHRA